MIKSAMHCARRRIEKRRSAQAQHRKEDHEELRCLVSTKVNRASRRGRAVVCWEGQHSSNAMQQEERRGCRGEDGMGRRKRRCGRCWAWFCFVDARLTGASRGHSSQRPGWMSYLMPDMGGTARAAGSYVYNRDGSSLLSAKGPARTLRIEPLILKSPVFSRITRV